MHSLSGEDLYDLRRKVQMHFKNIIEQIEIFPIGLPWDNTLHVLKDLIPKTIGKIYDIDEKDIKIMTKENRRYIANFKEGGFVSAKYDIIDKQYLRIVEVENTSEMMFTVGKLNLIN